MKSKFGSCDNLAEALSNYLQIPEASVFLSSTIVSGILKVPLRRHIAKKDLQIPICIAIQPNWFERIPLLYVNSAQPWLKTGDDWHVFEDRRICLEWRERWKEHLEQLTTTNANIPDIAAQWITNSAAHVLQVHYTCHVLKKTNWPRTIPFWAHSQEKASAEYKKEKSAIKRRP